MALTVSKSEVVWTLGLVSAVAGYFYQHPTLDAQTLIAAAAVAFAYLKSSPFAAK